MYIKPVVPKVAKVPLNFKLIKVSKTKMVHYYVKRWSGLSETRLLESGNRDLC